MSLVVYKSSAGSGKTSTLVIEYLALALIKPRQFRSIIALTFTIKATAEMKERLLEYLVYLQRMDIQNIDKKYNHIITKLESITSFSKQKIKDQSKILLQKILHNYGDFGFSTIDSFVIGIVRSFAHDLNLSSNFEIELDKNILINKALEKFYNLIGKDKGITNFLVDYVINQLEDEKSTDIDKPLSNLAALSFESKHYENIEKLKNIELNNFVKIKSILQKEINHFNKTITEFGEKGIKCLTNHGIKPKDCSYSWLSNYFNKLLTNHKYIYDISKLENKTFISFIEGDKKWYKKNQKTEIISKIEEAEPEIRKIIKDAQIFYKTHLPYFHTYKLILKSITPLALTHILKELINEYSEETEIIHISEANRKISEIIKDQHAPYIYERIGHKYNNYLIDEFQDTSVIQWNNILPLIDNSLANGNRCLLVGDAKQSIYRWRDGEVEQFVNLPKLKGSENSRLIAERENLLTNTIKFQHLDVNYRSLKNIIDFNNTLFGHLLDYEDEYVKNIFTNYIQETPKQKDEGLIKLVNFENDTDNKKLLDEIYEQIVDLISNQNYKPNEIAILARKRNTLTEIADFLFNNGIKIMSNDALMLYKSKSVTFVISILNIISETNIPINSYIASRYLFENNLVSEIISFKNTAEFFTYLNSHNINLKLKKLQQESILEVLEEITNTLIPTNSRNQFIYTLLDIALTQTNKIGNSTIAFLKYWEENRDKLSINMPDTEDSVKLLTIHSAKGLEFPVVIFPALDMEEKLDGRDSLWIDSPEKINKLSPIFLVNNDNIGLKSSEAKIFEEELQRKKLDSLNLLYVACTRPTEQLFIYFSTKNNSTNLWTQKIKELPITKTDIEQREENKIIIGEKPKHITNIKAKSSSEKKVSSYIYNTWQNKIHIKSENNNTVKEIKKQKGIEIHYLLSKITEKTNINELLEKSIKLKEISQDYKNEYHNLLIEILNNKSTNIFFKHNDVSINEREIITQSNEIIRPDKVIIKEEEIWVVDFKYADYKKISETEKGKHQQQVKKYTEIIREVEVKKTRGFLLYLQGLTRLVNVFS